jgi:hypothetical protein
MRPKRSIAWASMTDAVLEGDCMNAVIALTPAAFVANSARYREAMGMIGGADFGGGATLWQTLQLRSNTAFPSGTAAKHSTAAAEKMSPAASGSKACFMSVLPRVTLDEKIFLPSMEKIPKKTNRPSI